MGNPIIVYGKSGSGKSRSLKNFGEDEIFLINVEGKRLPFKKKFKYVAALDDIETIMSKLSKMPCKTAVIDDAGYLMTHYFMSHHREKSNGASFDMYDTIADNLFTLIRNIKTKLKDNINVYIMFHEDTSDFGETKLKTIGKLLDSKVCMEGMVTVCIRCMSEDGKHFFRVHTNGSDITKTPEEMFKDDEIENDLKAVDTAIRSYWEI